MTRAEKQIRREKIRNEYQNGEHPTAIAKRYNLTETYIYCICKGLTSPNNKGYSVILRENNDEIKALITNGATQSEIASRYNVSVYAVKEFVKYNELTKGPAKIDAKEAARRIRNKTDGQFEYISGYTTKDSNVLVRCTTCGETFERTYHHLTTHGYGCPACLKRKKEKEKAEKSAQKERDKQKKKAERFNRSRLLTMKICVECGALFVPRDNNNIRCSTQCTKRANNRNADTRLNSDNVIDKDITLTRLFYRDNGTCWLCGKKCDWKNQTQSGKTVVCGGDYPSIDHIVPLSKGGLHSWQNVRLAHRRCNTIKRDKIV